LRSLEAKWSHWRARRAADARHDEVRSVDLISEIDSNWAYRRRIPNTEPDGVGEIIQLIRAVIDAYCGIRSARGQRWILQCENGLGRISPKRDSIEPAVNVASVVKNRSAQLCAHIGQPQRKAKFLVKHEHRLSAHGEARARIARSCLVQREASQ